MKNKTTVEKLILYSLVILNILFLAYWAILAFYSQLHYDDLHFFVEDEGNVGV